MQFNASLNLLDSNNTVQLEKRISLLKQIEIEGSISKAAKKVPMSYKTAWDAIDTMNNLCNNIVVEKVTGGKGGGGAKLTTYGKNLIQTYSTLKFEHNKFMQYLTKMTNFNTGALKSIQRVSMQLSARNQISGSIEHIDKGKVNGSIYIKLKSGYSLVSVITNSAIEDLELKLEDDVVAIFKSSSVLLTTDTALNISAKNKLQRNTKTIRKGEVNSEIVIDIGGDTIVSTITSSSLQSLGLKLGDSVTAIIKSSDVMIGK